VLALHYVGARPKEEDTKGEGTRYLFNLFIVLSITTHVIHPYDTF